MIRIKHKNSGKVLVRVGAACLEGVDLSGTAMRGAALPGADLSGADLRGADLRRAELGRPGPVAAREVFLIALGWTLFWPAYGSLLRWAYPLLYATPPVQWIVPLLNPIAWFFVITLWCALRICQATARWAQARWASANLRGANLQGADLSGAALAGAKLTGARYDAHTRWPDGFDPEHRGAVRVE